MKNAHKMNVYSLAVIAMMSAVAIILGFWPEIPIPLTPWLKLDFAYLPMLLTGFSLGIMPGFVVLLLKNLFQLLTTNSQLVGQAADILMGCSLLIPSVVIYRQRRNRSGALISMTVGIIAMTVLSVPVNQFILFPLYSALYGAFVEEYLSSHPLILLTAVIPFNLLKSVLVCAVTYLLYKPLSPFMKKGLVKTKATPGKKGLD